MFKRLTAFLLLVALINCAFSRFAVYAGFELNRSYIAQNLCINKSRPWLHCNGHCYFMKKITQARDNEKKQNDRDYLNKLNISIFQEPFKLMFAQPVISENTNAGATVYSFAFTSRNPGAIFQPPRPIA